MLYVIYYILPELAKVYHTLWGPRQTAVRLTTYFPMEIGGSPSETSHFAAFVPTHAVATRASEARWSYTHRQTRVPRYLPEEVSSVSSQAASPHPLSNWPRVRELTHELSRVYSGREPEGRSSIQLRSGFGRNRLWPFLTYRMPTVGTSIIANRLSRNGRETFPFWWSPFGSGRVSDLVTANLKTALYEGHNSQELKSDLTIH